MSQRILIAGGGTGGHVFPALAVARELTQHGHELLFVGAERGLEARLVPAAGFQVELLEVEGLAARPLAAKLRSLALLPRAVWRARTILRRFRPAAILGVGGYASGPVLLAGWLARIPIVVHEQNAVMGLTNRLATRLASRVALSFEPDGKLPRKARVTGNPVRPQFFAQPPPACNSPLKLLVFGGSQGARDLNRALADALPRLARHDHPPRIVHQTGAAWLEEMRTRYAEAAYPDAELRAFIDTMPAAMGKADLVLCRAGATTVSELAATGRGGILVPFAAAAGSHQLLNARHLERVGAAVVVPQAELDGDRLAELLAPYVDAPAFARELGDKARTLARPDAATRVAELLLELAGEPPAEVEVEAPPSDAGAEAPSPDQEPMP